MAPPRLGHGLAVEVSLEVPSGSLPFWAERLERYGAPIGVGEMRFGDRVLPLVDPHGMKVALVESAAPKARMFTPWDDSPVPSEQQIRGLYSARLWERDARMTSQFLTEVLGFRHLGTEGGWSRYGFDRSAGSVDIRETPDERRGMWGVGAVHHLAWRVDDEQHQLAVRERIESGGGRATPVIDRFWFKSVYFKEPGGVLFELATDGPGFAVDEDRMHLGERLVLPPWLESSRPSIERVLPVLTRPSLAVPK
jgi:glyoxalase family protein